MLVGELRELLDKYDIYYQAWIFGNGSYITKLEEVPIGNDFGCQLDLADVVYDESTKRHIDLKLFKWALPILKRGNRLNTLIGTAFQKSFPWYDDDGRVDPGPEAMTRFGLLLETIPDLNETIIKRITNTLCNELIKSINGDRKVSASVLTALNLLYPKYLYRPFMKERLEIYKGTSFVFERGIYQRYVRKEIRDWIAL